MNFREKLPVYLARAFIAMFVLVPVGFRLLAGRTTTPVATYGTYFADVPTIYLRRGGYMDSSWIHLYIARPIINKRVLRISGGLPYDISKSSPPPIDTQIIRTTPSKESHFEIVWSPNSNRVACIFSGWLIGAYDIKTGEELVPLRGNKDEAIVAHQQIDKFLHK